MVNTRYEGGLDKLVPIEDAVDAHQAVGLWWARILLEADANRDVKDEFTALLSGLMSLGIGGFAEALGDLSRERNTFRTGVDLHISQELLDAANLAGMSEVDVSVIPMGNTTYVQEGKMYARTGYDFSPTQVWPPLEENEVVTLF